MSGRWGRDGSGLKVQRMWVQLSAPTWHLRESVLHWNVIHIHPENTYTHKIKINVYFLIKWERGEKENTVVNISKSQAAN